MKPLSSGYHAIVQALVVVVLLVGGGAVGYRLIEGWPVFDALYMSVITLTSVGFQEVHPLSTEGRAFTMILLLIGVFSLFYAATTLIRAIVGGELTGQIGRNRMEKKLQTLRDHIIVCGYGRMGRLVAHEFSREGSPFVVIERNADLLAGFDLAHGVPLCGDATHDETLKRAGILRARNLVTVAASDADNLFITMSARLMSDLIFIVARAEDEGAEAKLVKAGANRVISPYMIGGQRVAQAAMQPSVVDFIDLATRSDYLALQIEETEVKEGSPLIGKEMRDTGLRKDLGLIVVAIKRADGGMIFNPSPDSPIIVGDTLITLGASDQHDRLKTIAADDQN